MTFHQSFKVISASAVNSILSGKHAQVVELIKQAYLLHAQGDTVNPDSYFLRFPQKAADRIIALPAYAGGQANVAGIKWIASFPGNVQENLARASAVVILNSYETGFPFACIEGSIISAYRTAASAVLAAALMHPPGKKANCIGVIGTGLIATTIIEFLVNTGWHFERLCLFDIDRNRCENFGNAITSKHGIGYTIAASAEQAIAASQLIIFATTSGKPYVHDAELFSNDKTVLHISLRDIDTGIILRAQNFVDDIEHCLKANTSLHLTEQKTGNRNFIEGTISQLITADKEIRKDCPRIFSPFGLGVLDLTLSKFVYDEACQKGMAISIENFFPA